MKNSNLGILSMGISRRHTIDPLSSARSEQIYTAPVPFSGIAALIPQPKRSRQEDWFAKIRDIYFLYDILHPLLLLQQPPSKDTFKKFVYYIGIRWTSTGSHCRTLRTWCYMVLGSRSTYSQVWAI